MNPIHEHEGKWWFWNETWSTRIGPYSTEKKAKINLDIHCKWLDQENRRSLDEG